MYLSERGDGEDLRPYKFDEEPLGIGKSHICGYFQGGPGSLLGPNDRYQIRAKLGRGSRNKRYVSIKIMKGTGVSRIGGLKRVSESPSGSHIVRLLDNFIHPGIDDDGDHLCLVTDVFHPNVVNCIVQARSMSSYYIPSSATKKILADVLRGLAHLHKCGVAHTELSNLDVLLDYSHHQSTEAIDAWLKQNPPRPRTYPERPSLKNKSVTSSVSQPLPLPPLEMFASCDFKVSCFGRARFISYSSPPSISRFQPPEIVLDAPWDQSTDIWSLGTMAYEMVSNDVLFRPERHHNPETGASWNRALLYEMILLLDDFRQASSLLQRSHTLGRFKEFQMKPLEERILERRPNLSREELAGAVDFIGQCLRFEPSTRPTAEELLNHPWLKTDA
ncbi:hypothetical protein H0H92_003690 [Tricholoma furcatifolium]|nr:hypothetical protein H0H92_003690 [Tricholoma furcatifolium]